MADARGSRAGANASSRVNDMQNTPTSGHSHAKGVVERAFITLSLSPCGSPGMDGASSRQVRMRSDVFVRRRGGRS
ncbi:hypothetical protein SAQ01S_11300 [Sphingomonas aquatilis NBRC 16722]|nr:hypothetical protein SAQ01S_11300 [Sphingomonas aquatilis NBRC 16722]